MRLMREWVRAWRQTDRLTNGLVGLTGIDLQGCQNGHIYGIKCSFLAHFLYGFNSFRNYDVLGLKIAPQQHFVSWDGICNPIARQKSPSIPARAQSPMCLVEPSDEPAIRRC